MFVRLGKILVVLALVAMLGAQWALLQTVAWTAMLANNLEQNSFQTAVTRTFDGRHLCSLCKAIAAEKKSSRQSESSFQSQKLEFPLFQENLILFAPSQFQVLPLKNFFAKSCSQKPPLPPPREFFV